VGTREMERELKARPSLAHLANKFNTAPPPGYVPGRGRGVSGFSKPPPEPPRRAKGRGGSSIEAEGRYEDAEDAEAVGGADYEPDELDHAGGGYQAGGFDQEGKLKGEAGDTRELDLGGTEKFEVSRTSMTQMEAGYEIEPFNMKQERSEGHFDDDFNYVWKRRGDEADEAHDAWLGEIDEANEADEKVAKRRRLVAKQIAQISKQEEEAADIPALALTMAALLLPGETVSAGLRRLSEENRLKRKQGAGGKAAATGANGAGIGASDDASRKSLFDVLTEAADRLLRAGKFEVYSETREALEEMASAAAGASSTNSVVVAEGVTQEAHDAALAGGFTLDESSGYYFNSSNGLWFDARTKLYWPATGGDTYYTWNAEAQTFESVSAVVAPESASATE